MNHTHLYRKPPSISECFSDSAWYVQKYAIMNTIFEHVYNQHKTKSQTWFMRSRFFNLRSAQIVGNGLYMYKKIWLLTSERESARGTCTNQQDSDPCKILAVPTGPHPASAWGFAPDEWYTHVHIYIVHIYMCVYVYTHIYIHIYIYTHTERARERQR